MKGIPVYDVNKKGAGAMIHSNYHLLESRNLWQA